SSLIFIINWNEQNRIVNIRVIGANGEAITYQARRKSIEGRKFVTLDGRNVALGDNDRIEMIEE
ncbi:MAG: antitermination protein NusG, partial [Pseudomonadota bacterium]|nr:antitermination protein NusG [Pseudomonadota bacterium]